MKKYLVSLLLVLALLPGLTLAQTKAKPLPVNAKPAPTANAAAKPIPQQQSYDIPFVTKKLANGMEIIVLPDNSVPLVTVEIAVRNGSFTEPPEFNGLSHLYEHMFFKQNSARIVNDCESALKNGPLSDYGRRVCEPQLKLKAQIGDVSYLDKINQIGSVSNAETHEEVVNYYFTTTAPHVASALRFIRDSIRFPVFDGDAFDREKEVVIAELDRNLSSPGYYLERTMMDKLFYKYPSRKSPGGTRQTVGEATPEQMRTIQNRYYVPNNSALIVTGDVDPIRIFAMAEAMFGDWKAAEDPFKRYPIVEHPPLTKSEGVIVEQPIQVALIQLGWHGPSIGQDDAATYAADVFSYIVKQPDSRLQRALIDSGLALSVSVHYYTQRNTGPIRITMACAPDKAKEALKVLYDEIAQFDKPDYFTDEELANAKSLLESEDLYRREKLTEYSHTLSFWWSSTGVEYFRGYHRNLRAVSREDINRYIKTYIHEKSRIGLLLTARELKAMTKLTETDLTGGAK
jgi:zinc protease